MLAVSIYQHGGREYNIHFLAADIFYRVIDRVCIYRSRFDLSGVTGQAI